MSSGGLGKVYEDGEILMRQGETGDGMLVIQEGQAEIVVDRDGLSTRVRIAGEGEIIGEMALFENEVHSATVRAMGRVRALTVDRRNFLRQINDDPSIAFRLVQTMSRRVRELSEEVVRLKQRP
jgi:CRP/FNR family transcriptional regulator